MESSWSDGDCRNINDYYKYAEHDVKANEGKKMPDRIMSFK